MFGRSHRCVFAVTVFFSFLAVQPVIFARAMPSKDKTYQEYLAFFEEVYGMFEKNYYIPPDRAVFLTSAKVQN